MDSIISHMHGTNQISRYRNILICAFNRHKSNGVIEFQGKVKCTMSLLTRYQVHTPKTLAVLRNSGGFDCVKLEFSMSECHFKLSNTGKLLPLVF